MTEVFNPLDKLSLARSIEIELLSRDPIPLAQSGNIKGAGVYVIYYTGPFGAYETIRAVNPSLPDARPIYIGKAIPKGGRKGGIAKQISGQGRPLADRLKQHAASVDEVENLDLADFQVRYLVVDDVWIPLGENILIENFKPVWNRAIDGFGNKDPGRRRATQLNSPWDVLHPGREFTKKLAKSPLTQEFLLQRVADFFAGRQMAKLPKKVEEQLEQDRAEAGEAAEET